MPLLWYGLFIIKCEVFIMDLPKEFQQQKEYEKSGFKTERRNPFYASLFTGLGFCIGLALGYAFGHLGLFMLLGLAAGFALGTAVEYKVTEKISAKEKAEAEKINASSQNSSDE